MSSFGEELRRERELRRITLREVAESTKISLRYLESLERNEFDNLPGGVFNRGFVRAYAEYIGIDPDSTVTSYLMEEQSRLSDSAAVYGRDGVLRRGAEHAPAASRKVAILGRSGWLVVLGAVAILLATFLIVVAWHWLGGTGGDAEAVGIDAPRTTAAPAERPTEQADLPPPTDRSGETPLESGASDQDSATTAPVTSVQADPPAQRAQVEAAPVPDPPPAAAPRPSDALLTRVRLLRATTGRLNCDNTRIEILDGLRPGTSIEFLCKRFLTVDAEDGGAVEVGLGEDPARVLGSDGERIVGRRIDVARRRSAGDRS